MSKPSYREDFPTILFGAAQRGHPSLPNYEYRRSVGRLPSVSLERDEGEGKVHPDSRHRAAPEHVTINGIHVPSPEGVRNVKLDAILPTLGHGEYQQRPFLPIGCGCHWRFGEPGDQESTDKPYVRFLGMGGLHPHR